MSGIRRWAVFRPERVSTTFADVVLEDAKRFLSGVGNQLVLRQPYIEGVLGPVDGVWARDCLDVWRGILSPPRLAIGLI